MNNPQGFNTAYPVIFGGSWLKANGGVFLEPSFLSLFSVIGLVLVSEADLVNGRRRRIVVAVLLVGGLFSSVAVSGAVLLPLLAVRYVRSLRALTRTVVIAAAAVLIGGRIPVVAAFWHKLTLDPFGDTSASLRLYRPYSRLLPSVSSAPWFGHGPGSSRQIVDVNSLETTTPTLVKLLVEYGLVGATAFLLLVLLAGWQSTLSPVLRATLIVALTVPTDGLTSAVLMPLTAFAFAASRRSGPLLSGFSDTSRPLPTSRPLEVRAPAPASRSPNSDPVNA